MPDWRCPLCTHRVPYGTGCSDDWRTCQRGEKNILYWFKMQNQTDQSGDVQGIGISEIANEDQ